MDRLIQTKNVGILKGELLIFGGVYSNLEALISIKDECEKRNISPQNIICTGDIVGYCANPVECMDFIMDWGIHVIAGNVEIQLRENSDDCGCNFEESSRCDIFSRKWYPFAKSKLNEQHIQWMMELPDHLAFTYANKRVEVVHGSFFDTSEFIFKSTPWSTKLENFKATETQIILAGHCGLPFSDCKNNLFWLNSGALGMPANDGNDEVWYMTMSDHNDLEFEHQRLSYDNQKTYENMLANKLPIEYAKTIITGIWDNCEILPETEKQQQGEAITEDSLKVLR